MSVLYILQGQRSELFMQWFLYSGLFDCMTDHQLAMNIKCRCFVQPTVLARTLVTGRWLGAKHEPTDVSH